MKPSKAVEEILQEFETNVFGSVPVTKHLITTNLKEALTTLEARVREERDKEIFEQMGFRDLVKIAEKMLDLRYPEDVWTGSSGDMGAKFVVNLRGLIKSINNKEE